VIRFLNIFENYSALWNVKGKKVFGYKFESNHHFPLSTFPSLQVLTDEYQAQNKTPATKRFL
jgi:hypothetical protein